MCDAPKPPLDGLTAEQLIAAANTAGFTVSARQLRRWVSEGLLPRPRQPGLGAGNGRAPRCFPKEAAGQLLALCRLRKTISSIKGIGWELFWQSYEVGEKFWRPELKRAARDLDAKLAQIKRAGVGDGEIPDKVFDMLSLIYHSSTDNKIIRQIRKRLDEGRFQTFLMTMLQTATGRYEGLPKWHDATEHDEAAAILTRGFGLQQIGRAEVQSHIGAPQLDATIDAPLSWLAMRLRQGSAAASLRAASDQDIRSARDELRSILTLLSDAAGALRSEFGERASALNTLSTTMTGTAKTRKQMLLFWIWCGPASELRCGTRDLIFALKGEDPTP
jgi:hypothetical protein